MKLVTLTFALFWITAIFILLDCFIINDPNNVLDVNVYDTYYVIAHGLVAKVFALIFFALGLGYFLMKVLKKRLSRILIIVHLVGTVGIAWLHYVVLKFSSFFGITYELINSFIFISFMIALFVQPFYIANLIRAIIKPMASR